VHNLAGRGCPRSLKIAVSGDLVKSALCWLYCQQVINYIKMNYASVPFTNMIIHSTGMTQLHGTIVYTGNT